jgi:2-polyprenyl-3-methyl-5-hydroxy-6-metoxy-1,4-benzoquinol methylase
LAHLREPKGIVLKQSEGLEYIPCGLCGGTETEFLFSLQVLPQHKGRFNRDIWEIVRCQNCGLVYENPRPDEKALHNFYAFEISEDLNFVESWFINNADLNRGMWRRILKAIGRFSKPGQLLDIGCGAGTFLTEAKNLGYDVQGQEIAPFFIDYCRHKLGLKIFDDSLEKLCLPPASFDCVTAFDVIEHHPYPSQLVKEMRRLVKPGGIVVLGTHDFGNPFARHYGVKWRHMYAIGHLTYFTRQTLSWLVRRQALEVLQISGEHTIDGSPFKEALQYPAQFMRVILIRALILYLYKPVTDRIPLLSKWKISMNGGKLDHAKLIMRAGSQIIMNDNIILIAKAV